jgi:hypothetical protein
MKRIILTIIISAGAVNIMAQLKTDVFIKECDKMGLQFLTAAIKNNFIAIQLDTTVAKQYDYAVASTDGEIEYRYRLFPALKDSAAAAFGFQYFLYEAAKIQAGYPKIELKPYAQKTVAAAYNGSGGYSSSFKPGDWMATKFSVCTCFAFYKEGIGGFIIYMLTNDSKILLEEKYAAGLVGVLSFK